MSKNTTLTLVQTAFWAALIAVLAGLIYLLLGAIGLPVFANGGAGFQSLLGPTAGYLWGIPLYLGATSLLTKPDSNILTIFVANLVGDSLLFVAGWLGLQVLAGMTPQAAFTVSVLPFIMVDLMKVIVLTAISKPILRVIALHL